MKIQSYNDLEIYQMAHSLAIEIHEMSLNLPKFELYEEGQQIRRSSKSASACIVEGFGRRRYKNDFIRYLVYAVSETDETKEHLEFLFKTGSLTDKKLFGYFFAKYTELGKKIINFIKSVESHHKT